MSDQPIKSDVVRRANGDVVVEVSGAQGALAEINFSHIVRGIFGALGFAPQPAQKGGQ
jgi:hypothetical protein